MALNILWVSKALTVIVSIDCANQAEELNHPTEAILHLRNKYARQNLEQQRKIHHYFIINKWILPGVRISAGKNVAPEM